MVASEELTAICVQRFDDSRNSAIHTTYRISLRSSSLREPRYPLLRVVSVASRGSPARVSASGKRFGLVRKKKSRARRASVSRRKLGGAAHVAAARRSSRVDIG